MKSYIFHHLHDTTTTKEKIVHRLIFAINWFLHKKKNFFLNFIIFKRYLSLYIYNAIWYVMSVLFSQAEPIRPSCQSINLHLISKDTLLPVKSSAATE